MKSRHNFTSCVKQGRFKDVYLKYYTMYSMRSYKMTNTSKGFEKGFLLELKIAILFIIKKAYWLWMVNKI